MTPGAVAVLNLAAVQHNLSVVRSCAPGAKIMAVIKANGYGHGMVRIAETLQNVDAFAVARVDEGVRLRKAGIKNRIAVLEGFSCSKELDELLDYHLEPVVHSFAQLEIFETAPFRSLTAETESGCLNQSICREPSRTVWLKIDTGMNRLGFKPTDFAVAYQRLNKCLLISHINLMTHFANADDVTDDKTQQQINLFNDTVDGVAGERSLANSAAIVAWEQSLSDWVRPGVLLYGISPFPDSTGRQLGLQPVMELHSRLIAVKQIDAGDTVGYGGSWICKKPTTMGVVAIGYGDGYPRYAKAGTPVLVNGQRVPLIGRVSMDMITVDLGDLTNAKPGDSVTLWGEALPVEEIALWSDTIPYTLVCGVTQRVQLIDKNA
jgi:alanine racemase